MISSKYPILTHRRTENGTQSASRSQHMVSNIYPERAWSTRVSTSVRGTVRRSDGYAKKFYVVRIEETASFLRFNSNVSSGYRQHPLSIRDAMYSMVGYIHNETANIYSHLFGALLFTYFVVLSNNEWLNNRLHYALITVYDISCVICLFGSVAYHTFMNSARTEKGYQKLILFDMYGIWFINTVCIAF